MKMKRDPSLHITQSQLVLVLKKIKDLDDSLEFDAKELANQILVRSKTQAPLQRSLSLSDEKVIQKARKITSTTGQITQLFNKTLTLVRKQKKHIGITMITETHKDWPLLKQIAQDAENFRKEFGIKDTSEAYQIYLDIAFKKINKFALFKLLNLYSTICESYGAMLKIRTCPEPNLMKQAWEIYRRNIIKKTGACFNYEELPEKYIYFGEAVETAKKLGARIEDYINAQFHQLEWTNGIPDPAQLVGQKAEERFMKFAYSSNIQTRRNPGKKIDIHRIIQLQ